MGFDCILAIIAGSDKENGWIRWTEGDKQLSYCKSDVNIRTEIVLVWEQGKPFMQISVFYLLTTIVKFCIALAKDSLDEQSFDVAISRSVEALKKMP